MVVYVGGVRGGIGPMREDLRASRAVLLGGWQAWKECGGRCPKSRVRWERASGTHEPSGVRTVVMPAVQPALLLLLLAPCCVLLPSCPCSSQAAPPLPAAAPAARPRRRRRHPHLVQASGRRWCPRQTAKCWTQCGCMACWAASASRCAEAGACCAGVGEWVAVVVAGSGSRGGSRG